MRDITMRDIDLLHFVQSIFLYEPGEEMVLENIVAEDWRIHGEGEDTMAIIRPTVNQYMHTPVAGHIRRVRFQDIAVTGEPGEMRVIVEGYDAAHRSEDVVFENVTIGGRPLAADSPNVVVGDEALLGEITFR
jgi:hypothetical protein